MLDALKRLFENRAGTEPGAPDHDDNTLRLATAALLVEMARADFEEDDEEREAILRILSRDFSLAADEARQVLEAADAEAGRAVSLHEFTSVLHASLSEQEKRQVVKTLWEVALADGRIDKYEDYLVRKVADLLYLPDGELVRLKHVVLAAQAAD